MFSAISCNANDSGRQGGPYYFAKFIGYQIPFQPSEEISYEEAKKRNTYYVAHFDEEGRIVSFSKYLKGKLIFIDKYYYDSGSLARREMTKSTGETTTHYFDEKGKLIEP
jgi:antitoxin component YwqK of YwqJK toxin-antitoxin module